MTLPPPPPPLSVWQGNVFILGRPGSGKTTAIRYLTQELENRKAFFEIWEADQNKDGGKKDQTTTFTFYGHTVFINRPSDIWKSLISRMEKVIPPGMAPKYILSDIPSLRLIESSTAMDRIRYRPVQFLGTIILYKATSLML